MDDSHLATVCILGNQIDLVSSRRQDVIFLVDGFHLLTDGDIALYIGLTGSRYALFSSDEFANLCGLGHAPIDPLLAFHVVFGKTVPDISLNAVANLGYAEGRFLAPVYAGDTLTSSSEVIGVKETSSGKNGVVHVRTAGLSSIEWRVLATLHDGASLTVGQLAHEVLSKQPTVTKLVQRMTEQGWLKLKADAQDQRCTRVTASAAGKRLVKPLVDEARDHERRLMRTLNAAETIALKKLLGKLAHLHN